MLAMILMLAVFPAVAEEAAAVREPSDSPNVYFGGDRTQTVEMFNHYWNLNCGIMISGIAGR